MIPDPVLGAAELRSGLDDCLDKDVASREDVVDDRIVVGDC